MKKLLSLVMVLAMALALVPGLTAVAEDIPTIKWVQQGNGKPENYDSWKAKLDAYLEEKIGVHLDLEVVNWGDWSNRRNVIINTNEPYDIMFSNLDTYVNDVHLGAFADISEAVKTAAPDLYNFIPEEYWKAVEVDGKVYGVPTYKDSSVALFFVWDQAMIDKYEIDAENITQLAQLDEPLRKIAEGESGPSFHLIKDGFNHILNWYDKLGTGLPLGVRFDDESRKVVSVLEQDDVMADLTLLHTWFKDGIINQDAAIRAEHPKYRPVFVEQGWSSAAKSIWGPQMGVEKAVAYPYGAVTLSNDSVQGSISCISSSSQNLEKTLEFLQLVNTDYIVRDALFYGEEGVDFNYVEGDPDHKVDRINKEWAMAGYTQGTFFIVSQDASVEINQWEEVKELNEIAEPSVMLGFYFDFTSLEDEVSNCRSIWDKYKSELMTGTADPAVTVPEMMEEMNAAGFNDIITEAQKQIDAFYQ
ncbi:MAG: ABC transporter substrate-binding protein [Clostridiales bacterium]|nr:ABC transporter substrate-binding protein [Clostridiales bacterium]